MDYSKLKGRIKEVCDTQYEFAKRMELPYASISQRLNGQVEWRTTDILKACQILMIDVTEVHLYFFKEKV